MSNPALRTNLRIRKLIRKEDRPIHRHISKRVENVGVLVDWNVVDQIRHGFINHPRSERRSVEQGLASGAYQFVWNQLHGHQRDSHSTRHFDIPQTSPGAAPPHDRVNETPTEIVRCCVARVPQQIKRQRSKMPGETSRAF